MRDINSFWGSLELGEKVDREGGFESDETKL
jgi:hypothetical protein